MARTPEIAGHLARIQAIVDSGRSYVEVGFPTFGITPALRRMFGDRLHLVQMTRDPVRVAASLVTHRWYIDGARDDVHGMVALTPSDAGVMMKSYAARWPTMTAFEKGLFLWAEIHAYGLEVEAETPRERFARFRAEDLLAPPSSRRRKLAAFLDLPERAKSTDGRKAKEYDDGRIDEGELCGSHIIFETNVKTEAIPVTAPERPRASKQLPKQAARTQQSR